MASDGGAALAVSLVEAAVRAAVAANAPRRTVAAAAAAVASAMAALHGGNGARAGTTEPSATSERQRKKNQRKKERRRAARDAATADAGTAPSQGDGEHPGSPAAADAGPVATLPAELESAPIAVTPPLQPEPSQPGAATTAPRVSRRDLFATLGLEPPSDLSDSPSEASDSGASVHSKRPLPDVPFDLSLPATRPRLNPAPAGPAKPTGRPKASNSRQRPQRGQ
jgi:hypothetical protein